MLVKKGIILAGGRGTRLYPLTQTTSKQLLPVYDAQMIFYPLEKLLQAGIRDILVIVAPDHAGDFINLLQQYERFGISFTYKVQHEPRGIADAFIVGKEFIRGKPVVMVLGDNIFEYDFTADIASYTGGGMIFVKEVPDPARFGVVKFNEKNEPVEIVEKPKTFLSPFAITGMYVCDGDVSDIASTLKPSARGEIEVTDIYNHYLKSGDLIAKRIDGQWLDAGTIDSLHTASSFAKNFADKGESYFKVLQFPKN